MKFRILLFALGGVAAIAAPSAFAAGADTNVGISISNTATVNYSVGGVGQTAETASASFAVDRKVIVLVSGLSDDTVVPGQNQQPLLFRVTNNSNDSLDIALSATDQGGDNFDTTPGTFLYWLDDGDGIFEPGVGAGLDGNPITFLDDVPEDGTRDVWVTADIPSSGPTVGQTAIVALTATAADKAGSDALDVLSAAGPDDPDPAVVDNVFADIAGTTDIANDGKHSDTRTYTVVVANLQVSKTAAIISDPINGTGANRKAIPGAVIEYTISAVNNGSVDADLVRVTDPIPANTTYVDNSLDVDGGGCPDDEVPGVGPADVSDGCSAFGGIDAALGTISGGGAVTKTVKFRVTIN